ncbi:MAG TPA: Rieske 2Fe-2S domain-containing protein, partial [Nevskiaceae bacterium]|nr:Rieske 2Fe-2S domain-containing protein [Nevskiaceae bacterium]
MATSKDYGLGEFTYPRGWFLIADASKVTSEPQPLHFFGRDLALYRGKQSGKVFLLDAICPHMGTNIACETQSWTALDGRVEGDCIRC